ncbi:MAG TPA: hypothetical protein VHC22_22220 [Pirellulales bacterium]|nr:hypothetical protein [Pirellulales bacterium]
MKRFLFVALFLSASCFSAVPAQAENWMFQRSYYSHQPAEPVAIGRRARGGPYYTRPQGAYFNGGFRRLRSTINVGGLVYDNLNLFESWAQTGGQF